MLQLLISACYHRMRQLNTLKWA
uniref:Uncharacterized protein n=1 Tax=Arundo donax TaxID=35708 RepID=A0A0A8YJ95_ARUDO